MNKAINKYLGLCPKKRTFGDTIERFKTIDSNSAFSGDKQDHKRHKKSCILEMACLLHTNSKRISEEGNQD